MQSLLAKCRAFVLSRVSHTRIGKGFLEALLKKYINLNNKSYYYISRLVVLTNNGIHPKHKIMNYHQFFVDNVAENDVVLDLGCGNGFNTYDVASKAKKVMGIDKVSKNIDYAKNHYQRDNLQFSVGDAMTYNFNGTINKIILSNVLEHIDNRVEFLRKLHQICDTILLRVPMLTRDWLSVFKKEKGFEYRLDDTHFVEYSLENLSDELKQAGWKIKTGSVQYGEFWCIITTK